MAHALKCAAFGLLLGVVIDIAAAWILLEILDGPEFPY